MAMREMMQGGAALGPAPGEPAAKRVKIDTEEDPAARSEAGSPPSPDEAAVARKDAAAGEVRTPAEADPAQPQANGPASDAAEPAGTASSEADPRTAVPSEAAPAQPAQDNEGTADADRDAAPEPAKPNADAETKPAKLPAQSAPQEDEPAEVGAEELAKLKEEVETTKQTILSKHQAKKTVLVRDCRSYLSALIAFANASGDSALASSAEEAQALKYGNCVNKTLEMLAEEGCIDKPATDDE
mmetsp:Transcript_23372/g.74526  ORF Transcript_23372/g.74526 Transcript_23372/m.74526 type:complete len:243 (-) Transcript_23372:127-855(-)